MCVCTPEIKTPFCGQPGCEWPPQQRIQPNDCTHEDFRSVVRIGRILDAGKYVAEVTVHCTRCGSPFRFIGVPAGVRWDGPAASIDGLELRAPIEPEGEPRLAASASFQMPEIPKRH
jgi:hypothetical protein